MLTLSDCERQYSQKWLINQALNANYQHSVSYQLRKPSVENKLACTTLCNVSYFVLFFHLTPDDFTLEEKVKMTHFLFSMWYELSSQMPKTRRQFMWN
jgi:hypothetical protein